MTGEGAPRRARTALQQHPHVSPSVREAAASVYPLRVARATTLPMTNPDPLLSIEDTAQYLGLSAVTVRRMIRDGRLTAVRLGAAIRVRRSAIEQLLADSATS